MEKGSQRGVWSSLYIMENIEVEMDQGTARDFRAGRKLSSKNNGSKVSFFFFFLKRKKKIANKSKKEEE